MGIRAAAAAELQTGSVGADTPSSPDALEISMKKYLALLLALTMVAAACGDSDADDPRVAELAQGLVDDEDIDISQDEAECAARTVIGVLGDDEIQALIDNPGIDLEETGLSAEAQREAQSALLDCIDIEALMRASFVDQGATEEQAQCIVDGFGEDEIREFLEVAGGPDADSEAGLEILFKVLEVAAGCGFDLIG